MSGACPEVRVPLRSNHRMCTVLPLDTEEFLVTVNGVVEDPERRSRRAVSRLSNSTLKNRPITKS